MTPEYKEFILLVKDMRDKQKKYFKSKKDPNALFESKLVESKVDKHIQHELELIDPAGVQQELF